MAKFPFYGTQGINKNTRDIRHYVATEGQTTFGCFYTVGYVLVYVNGSCLPNTDFTANDGLSVILNTGCAADDNVVVEGSVASPLLDGYSKSQSDVLFAKHDKEFMQEFHGRIRTLTPTGGARVREWGDVTAQTTGPIEYGISFNADLDWNTGLWLPRDTTEICWLEKWNDVGGVKEYWYAPSASAGLVPVWTKVFSFDMVNGILNAGTINAVNINHTNGNGGQLHGTNVIVNGDCSISQVNGTTEVTPLTGSYPIDNVQYGLTQASKLKCDQTSSLMGALGAVWSLRTTVLAKYTPIATEVFYLQFPIEGLNFARFRYGTANAKAGSLQFKVLPSIAGTYSGCISNYASNRSYPFSFTVSAEDITAGGKRVKIENIPGDTGGTWVGATSAGAAVIRFDLGCGANFKGTANAWVAADIRGVTGALALVDQVNGSTLAITDVQFEVGAFCTQFERKLYDQNLRECQRYLPCWKSTGTTSIFSDAYTGSSTIGSVVLKFPATRVPCTGVVVSNVAHITVTSPSASSAASAVALIYTGEQACRLNFTVAGMTLGQGAEVMFTNSSALLYLTGAQI